MIGIDQSLSAPGTQSIPLPGIKVEVTTPKVAAAPGYISEVRYVYDTHTGTTGVVVVIHYHDGLGWLVRDMTLEWFKKDCRIV